MTISINQVKNGLGLRINNDIYIITDYSHVKPGKGTAFVRLKIKNVKTHQVLEKTYKTADKLDDVQLEQRKLQFMYSSGDEYHFMDNESYEQSALSSNVVGDVATFLQEDLEVTGLSLEGEVLRIELPIFIFTKITQTEPGFKGDTSKAGTKPATIDTGAILQVPLFIDIDDEIKVDTRTGSYVERVKR